MKIFLKILKWILIPLVLLAIGIFLFGIFIVAPRIQSKRQADHSQAMVSYREFLEDVGPEAQFEKHTCGPHMLRTIYKAYGLDPDEENLRFRLGVDVEANPIDSESTGTLQPDIFRVLLQDGFKYRLLPIEDEDVAADALSNHLEGGNMAALLISRRENGNMHWVAAHRVEESNILILDSLFADPYPENPTNLMKECILSCILLEPHSAPKNQPEKELLDGSEALYKTIQRFSKISKYRAQQDAARERR